MLVIRLLGPLEVVLAGEPVIVRGRMVQAVLARLALDAGTVVSVDALVDAIWGDDPPLGATNALQAKVSDLRRSLGAKAVVSRRPGYLLDVPVAAVDALAADALIARARRQVVDDPAAAGAFYAQALELWRGDPLASVLDAPFAGVAATRWRELRLAAFEERARLELHAGRTRPLISELEVEVAAHPTREPLVEVLMAALAAEGRQVAALAAFRELRERLVTELGIEPGPRLQELERRVLLQDPTVVRSPAGPGDGRPPLAAPVRVRLPHPLSSFVPRPDDLDGVLHLLATRRLVTITGAGGAGKTRLAIEAARRLDVPVDGIWFVPLESLVSADLVPDALAAVLGAVGPDVGTALRDRLRDASLLLVLDNGEHLADGLADLLTDLLEHAPGVRCLVTSQRTIGIPGEAQWPLGSLTRHQAVDLFVERARDVAPHASYEDRELLESLCAQLDDLPLAIELAAGRLGVLSVREVADRLRDRFLLLRDGRSGRVQRQQTLDRTISWSYELLFPHAQLALQALAGFTAGASIAGIESVMGRLELAPGEPFELLSQLVDRSLVVADRSGSVIRYRLLEGIRSFAAEQAVKDGRAVVIAHAHAAWVLELAAGARWGVRRVDQQRWLEAVRAERANIDAALGWMATNAPSDALQVVADLYLPWMMLGDSEAGAAKALRALDGATPRDDVRLVARAEACAAQLLARSGAVPRAVVLAERALARAGTARDVDQVEMASILGRVLIHAGRIDEGCGLVASAAGRFVELGDAWGEAMAQVSLAWASYLAGRPGPAGDACRASLAALGSQPDGWVAHAAHRLGGVLATEAGDHDTAVHEFSLALGVARAMGSATDEGQTLARIGWAQAIAGNRDEASAAYREAWHVSRLAGDHTAAEAARRELDVLLAASS